MKLRFSVRVSSPNVTFKKLLEAAAGIVIECAFPRHQRNDGIIVYCKQSPVIFITAHFFIRRIRVGDVQSLTIKAITSHHATYGITDKLLLSLHPAGIQYDYLLL